MGGEVHVGGDVHLACALRGGNRDSAIGGGHQHRATGDRLAGEFEGGIAKVKSFNGAHAAFPRQADFAAFERFGARDSVFGAGKGDDGPRTVGEGGGDGRGGPEDIDHRDDTTRSSPGAISCAPKKRSTRT